jgi:hypothetical protein
MADNITPLPMLDALRRHKQDRLENGYLFPLNATSIGLPEVIHARVRRLNSMDEAAINTLPQDMQETIWQGLKEFQAEQKKAAGMEDPQNLVEMMANNKKILKTADAWCLAAFIHPRLVRSDAEITGPDTWNVEDVEAEDRVAIFMACMDADSDQVKKLKLFRPTWGRAVSDGEAGPVAAETVRAVGPALAGV